MGQARLNEVFLSKSSPAFPSVRYDLGGDTGVTPKCWGSEPISVWSTPIDEIEEFKRIGIHYFAGANAKTILGRRGFITVAPLPGIYFTIPHFPYYLVKYRQA